MRLSKIDPRNQQGLRWLFNISDTRVNPEDLDMSSVQPVIDMSFGGYSKLPIPDDNKNEDFVCTVRSSTEVDPTITKSVVVNGDGDGTNIGYGVGYNAYVPLHRLLLTATDPETLQDSMGEYPVEVTLYLTTPAGTAVNLQTDIFKGVNELCQAVTDPIGTGTTYIPGLINYVYPPIVVPMGYKLQVAIKSRMYNLSSYEDITCEGLSAEYRAIVYKIPIGSPIPHLRKG